MAELGNEQRVVRNIALSLEKPPVAPSLLRGWGPRFIRKVFEW